MIVSTRDFGQIEISDDKAFTLTDPILGFEDYHRYALLEAERTHPILWFQSLDSSGLVFPVLDADFIGMDYADDLAKTRMEDIGARSVDDVRAMLIVVIPQDVSQVRANLRAPLLLNESRSMGKQVVFYDTTYPIQFPLTSSLNNAPEPLSCT